jgi:putative DNA primase/helicase
MVSAVSRLASVFPLKKEKRTMSIGCNDKVLPVIPENIPASLKEKARWLCWKAEPKKEKPDELTKVPYRASAPSRRADKTNESHWSDYGTAQAALNDPANSLSGLGFATGEGVVGIDIDNCIDPQSGALSPVAAEWVERLGSYAEKSPSGTGVRVLVRDRDGVVTKSLNKRKLGAEIYTHPNYVTVTGHRLGGAPQEVTDGGEHLKDFVDWLTSGGQAKDLNENKSPKPLADTKKAKNLKAATSFSIADEDVLRLASNAKNARKFNALLTGDRSGYESESEADMALASMLAFYAGPQGHDQVERLMRNSQLRRDKYDRADYLPRTVRSAIEKQTEFYKPAAAATGEANLMVPSTRTDLGFARRVVSALRGGARYEGGEQKWWGHDGQRFVADNAAAITGTAKKIGDEIWGEWKKLRTDRRQKTECFARRWASSAGIEAAVKLARSEEGIAIRADEFDRNPLLLNVENGTLDLRTLGLRDHSPGDLITHLASVTYDPAGKAETWLRFVHEVMAGDQEMVRFLRQVAGLAITGDVREQCLCIHYGSGRNGKSTFLTTLSDMLGSYAGPGPTNMLVYKGQHSQERELLFEALAGKRLVTASEADDGAKFSEATAKLLTGGDKVLARRRYWDSRPVTPTWHLHVAVNHRPQVVGRDAGIWGRVKLVPWSVTFDGSRQDPDLGEKLARERSGILNWCLEGLADWRANGLVAPHKINVETARYRDDFDVVGAWIADRCNVGPGCVEVASRLHEDYLQWAASRNEQGLTNTMFGVRMEERGFMGDRPTAGQYRGKTIRQGISLTAKPQESEEERGACA